MGSRIRRMSQGETDAIPPLAKKTGSHDCAAENMQSQDVFSSSIPSQQLPPENKTEYHMCIYI
jgi:hypothetical protein